VVVLDELAVVDEILAEIEHFLDAVPDLLRLLRVVDPPDLAVRESHGRPLDGVDGDDPVGFPRTLRLDLGARREEVVDEVHGRRVDPAGREPVVARATVSKSESTRLTRVGKDGTACDQVPEELL